MRARSKGWPVSSAGFTLIELVAVLAIISSLAALSYPVAVHGTRQFKLLQCMNNARKVGRATIECLAEEDIGPGIQSQKAWMARLERRGIDAKLWICPTRRSAGNSQKGDCDFFYAGAESAAIVNGERLGELYLWVETYPNHDGSHVCSMGDGTVRVERLLRRGR